MPGILGVGRWFLGFAASVLAAIPVVWLAAFSATAYSAHSATSASDVSCDNSTLLATVLPSMVRVEARTASSVGRQGSGVVVDSQQGYVLTAGHVVTEASSVAAVFRNGHIEMAEVVANFVAADVALLRIRPLDWPDIQFSESTSMQEWDQVATVGFADGSYRSYRGEVLNRPSDLVGRSSIVSNAAAVPGMSDGAMVTRCGVLVGILTRGRSGDWPTSVATQLSGPDIRALTGYVSHLPTPQRPPVVIEMSWPGASALAPSLGPILGPTN